MDQSELKGIIDRFLFQNNENGYAVFALKIDDKTSITVRGYLANVHPGQEVVCKAPGTLIQNLANNLKQNPIQLKCPRASWDSRPI
jgi:hypothetical protein